VRESAVGRTFLSDTVTDKNVRSTSVTDRNVRSTAEIRLSEPSRHRYEPTLPRPRTDSRGNVEPLDPLIDSSDEELLASFRRGQREAFGVLVRRYQGELFGYLRRYLGDSNLAEDVFQSTFLQVYIKIDQYELGRPVRPWLYTIATHQAIDAMRRSGRHQALSLDQAREDGTREDLHHLVETLETRGPGPLDLAQGEERRQLVRAGVDRLPDFLKQVVILAYYQGLKYRDIAEVLGIPVGTVKSRLHSALMKLQEAWSAASALQDN
jgi:RNA polymerase sigma-70 factor (ECF subfamily)